MPAAAVPSVNHSAPDPPVTPAVRPAASASAIVRTTAPGGNTRMP